MQKKKIIYLITKSNFGGAQKYVYELATSLDKNLFDITVLLGGEGLLKEKLEKDGIRVISIPDLKRDISFLKEFEILWFLIKFFNKEKPDIVHLNSAKASGIGAVAAKLSKLQTCLPDRQATNYKLQTIFTAHGWAFNEKRPLLQKVFIKFLSWITVLLSDKTIAVSNSIKNQISDLPFVKNKIEVIWNGVKDIDFLPVIPAKAGIQDMFCHPEPACRRGRFISGSQRDSDFRQNDKKIECESENTIWIGTIAELHPVKGIDILIEAAKKVLEKEKYTQFVVMGEGEMRKKLEEQIKKLNLENNFILLGFVKDAPRYLKAFDIFVLSSHSEALSIAILEAGLAQVPVIATNVGGIPEIISDSRFGSLVESNNPDQLAKEILNVLENKEEAEKKAVNLKERVSEEFGFEKMVERTLSLY